MANVKLCLFSSTPDIAAHNFMVRVLTGSPGELADRAAAWGYDGVEFLPDPENVPDPAPFARALRDAGACLPVVNTGRLAAQGLTLLHPDAGVARRALAAFRRVLDFAGALGARVGLGIARGKPPAGLGPEDADRLAETLFVEVADHAARAGTVVMLEPAESEYTRFVATVDECMGWVRRVNSPAFSVMLDTQQLCASEPSVEHGVRAAGGQARHIHLYDPSRWPPGLGPTRLDWDALFRVLREQKFAGSASVVLVPEGDAEPAARQTAAFLRRHLEEKDRS